MSQELQQYASIIEQLKPMVKEPEFNQVLEQVAANIPKEKRFLIKMEVKRLAKPCIRSIDLRGQAQEEVKQYSFEGINHYMDDAAIEVFEQQLRVFGNYCFGVYEAVLEHTRQQINNEREKAERNAEIDNDSGETSTTRRYVAPIVNLLDYAQRHSERMNFAVSLEVFTDQNKSFLATSIDVSTSGIKIKTHSDMAFKQGDKVSIHFRGLESEFALDKRDAIVYYIVKTERERKEQIIRLMRAEDYPNPPFDQFLEKFIHGNKRRYKVNMNNTIDAIINKSCEQYFTPRFPSLPVFVDAVDEQLIPRFAMLNMANRDLVDYWTDEEGELKLGYMLKQSRLKYICEDNLGADTYVYAFNHIQNERIYFYSATQDELYKLPKYKNLYWGFGSRKVSWRVFKIKAAAASSEDAHSPLSIPDSIGKKIKLQNAPPAPRLMSRLKHMRYVLHITDVTSELGQQCYASQKIDRGAIKQLRVFGHPRNRQPAVIKPFRYKYHENRIESRYLLRSVVEVTYADVTLEGITEDISVHGLRVELNKPFHGAADCRVVLNFPKLQEMTKTFDLTALQYRVVNISDDYTVLHLRSINGEEGKPARAFFDELIKQNRSRLKTYPEEEEYPGIGHALRCINAKNTLITSFVVQKKKGRFFPYACVLPEETTRVKTISTYLSKPGEVDLEFLFRDRVSDDPFIDVGFKQARAENRAITAELFVMFDPTQSHQKLVLMTRWSHSFNNHKVRQNFIEEALRRGQFIAIKAVLTNADKPDMEMLQLEMNYVSMYALHRAKALEENLWAITGCVHLFDITDEVMARYRYAGDVIARNRTIESTHKVEPDGIKALLNSSQDRQLSSSSNTASNG